MANNSMYLVHRPTGRAICIASRAALGWEPTKMATKENLESFFDDCGDEMGWILEGQDDFALCLETTDGEAPFVVTSWQYAGDKNRITAGGMGHGGSAPQVIHIAPGSASSRHPIKEGQVLVVKESRADGGIVLTSPGQTGGKTDDRS